MKNRTGNCDEEIFWECVREIGWPVENLDRAMAQILRAWSPEFSQSFYETASSKVADIKRIVAKTSGADDHISGDSLDDLCWHVIGLGKSVFENESSDSEALIGRIKSNNFQESFSYVFPCLPSAMLSFDEWRDRERRNRDDDYSEMQWLHESKGDWIRICPNYYSRWAERLLPGIAAFLAELEHPSSENESAAVLMAAELVHYLALVIDGKTSDAVSMSEKALRSWWGLYHMAENLGVFRQSYIELLPMIVYEYSGENLVNDHREFMGGINSFPCRYHLREIMFQGTGWRDRL